MNTMAENRTLIPVKYPEVLEILKEKIRSYSIFKNADNYTGATRIFSHRSPIITSIFFFFLCCFSFPVLAAPIKVPKETFYKGFPNLRNHPGHYPYISDITFRRISDLTIDEHTDWFDPDSVKQGDILYLNIWYLEWFTNHVHDQIKNPYILLTHDVGGWLPHPNIKKLLYDPKVAAWFCRNMVFSYHPKLFQNPMGQDIYIFKGNPEAVNDLINVEKNRPFEKKHLLYMNHAARAFGERDRLVKLFEHAPYCFSRNHSSETHQPLAPEMFYKELAASKFVLSPLGLETDCVRTWEAFIFDCIPIVEHTFLDPLYEGLPILFTYDWSEINEQYLNEKYEQLKHLNNERAYFDYWHSLITKIQEKIKRGDCSSAALEATKFNEQDSKDFYFILKNYGKSQELLYKGFLSALRPLQMVDNCPFLKKIYLYDPWLDEKMFTNLKDYLQDLSILKNNHKIRLCSSEKEFAEFLSPSSTCIFLDLTYYRTSLEINFATSTIEKGNLRQSLKEDLSAIFKKLPSGSLLFGNMVDNDYVKKMLRIFSRENGVNIEKQGAFWFIIK